MHRLRASSDPSQPNAPDPQTHSRTIWSDSSESDDDGLASSSSSRRDRASSLSWNPRKRRMSLLQRAATRLRGDRSQAPLPQPSSSASSPSQTPSSPRKPHNGRSNHVPEPPESEPDYPPWLRKILQEHNGTSVAVAYQSSPPDSESQYTTFTPIRCSFPDVDNDQSGVAVKFNDFGYASVKNGSEMTLGPAANGAPALPLKFLSFNEPRPEKPTKGRNTRLDTNRVPVEIWEQIMESLSRDDVKNLRLVDKAIERCTSGRLFKTVVVPFTTDIYGALADAAVPDSETPLSRGKNWFSKGRGLNVFRGFGRHIRNFGMSFEVDEASLSDPPTKVLQQGHESYWGTYSWPFPQYARFKDRADLEVTADETSTMKLAFSHLDGVKHLALSLDSGLGWLGGPDKSIPARILRRPSSIFGSSFHQDPDTLAQRQLWALLEDSYRQAGHSSLMFAELVRADVGDASKIHQITRKGPCVQTRARIALVADASLEISEPIKSRVKGKEIVSRSPPPTLGRRESAVEGNEWVIHRPSRLTGSPRRRRTSSIHNEVSRGPGDSGLGFVEPDEMANLTGNSSLPRAGLLVAKPVAPEHETQKTTVPPFVPGQLTKDQREWLLESAWAQDAFLSSYLLAVTDNASSFENVNALTITRFSSRHLPKLCRNDFWESLPLLKRLDLRIIADHRDVRKTEAGFVDTPSVRPSDAIAPFHHLISRYISHKSSIESLCLGWTDGGEHAEGIFGRNHNILPAPLSSNPLNFDETSWSSHLVRLPHIQELTLVNCWIAPNALQAFLGTGMYVPNLKHLSLESVSLTAHPKYERQVVNNGVPGLHAILMQQLANLNLPVPHHQAGQAAALAQQLAMQPQALAQALAHAQQNLVGNFIGHAQAMQAIQNAVAQQQQLQMQHQQGHQHIIQPGAAPIAMFNALHTLNPSQPREGSWSDVVGRIKEGVFETNQEQLCISFLSCGYVRLPGAFFDQTRVDEAETAYNIAHPVPAKQGNFFGHRRTALAEFMMTCQDSLTGHVALALTELEMDTLRNDWGLEEGWPSRDVWEGEHSGLDQDCWGKWGEKSKEAAEYDGARPGGTGRFSGRITMVS